MSALQTIKSLSSSEKGLISAYFTVNCIENIPDDIIHLCSLYLFILDEFDIKSAAQCNVKISGLNNTIASLETINETNSKRMIELFTYQKIKTTGKYHWQLSISSFNGKTLEVGFKNNYTSMVAEFHKFRLYVKPNAPKYIVDIYLDVDAAIMSINTPTYRDEKYLNSVVSENINPFKLCLCASDTQSIVVELLQYDNSNLYIHTLSNDADDVTSNVGYAHCIFASKHKIKHYEIALKQFPYVETWNDEYLKCLIDTKQWERAYKHAIKYQKGVNSIAKLINYYSQNEQNEYAHNLGLILTDEQLTSYDLCFQVGYCSGIAGDHKNAIKYYQMFYDQNCNDNNEEMKDNIDVCIGNMANIYYFDFDDDNKALELYLKLDETERDRRKFNAKIGSCYYKLKQYKKALQYLEKHVEKNEGDIWAINQISCIYDDMNDYENGKKYLFIALEAAKDDMDAKAKIYTNFGVNAYYQGNVSDAIKYTKEALALNVAMESTAIRRSNLGKYNYKMGRYDEAYKYLCEAIKLNGDYPDINGNYGIILYYMNRRDEAITYINKCLVNRNVVDDKELILDCMYVYGLILYGRDEFKESVNRGLEIIENGYFENYKQKEEVYKLLSDGYRKLLQFEEADKYLLKARECNQMCDAVTGVNQILGCFENR